jgi:Raf kinase inhibitor-like YbhB/YbcL family protein
VIAMKRTSTASLAAVVTACAVLVMGGCTDTVAKRAASGALQAKPGPTPAEATLTVTSTALAAGATIPKKYTGDGADVSPPLAWLGAPATTKAFALICDDPDAPSGTFTHWGIWDIPATTTKLPEDVAKTDTVAAVGGAKQGRNDAGKVGYSGPAPPPGKPHRYNFTVYALDTPVGLKPGATARDLREAMVGHIVGNGALTVKYGR